MTKDPITVEKFIDDLVAKIHDKGQQEMHALVDLKHSKTGDQKSNFNSWDYAFYDNIMKKQQHVDELEIKQYFPSDHVVNATLEIY